MALLQRVSSLAPTLRSLSAQRPAFRFLVDRSVHFKDREKGEELVHFRKEDEKLLRKLLEKVRAQADKVSGSRMASLRFLASLVFVCACLACGRVELKPCNAQVDTKEAEDHAQKELTDLKVELVAYAPILYCLQAAYTIPDLTKIST